MTGAARNYISRCSQKVTTNIPPMHVCLVATDICIQSKKDYISLPGACVHVQVHVNITKVVMLSTIKQAKWWGVNMLTCVGAQEPETHDIILQLVELTKMYMYQ